jgi:hypothetical protein
MKQKRRIVEVKRGDTWVIIPFGELLENDVFKLYEFDWTPVPDANLSFEYTAASSAKKMPKSNVHMIKLATGEIAYEL